MATLQSFKSDQFDAATIQVEAAKFDTEKFRAAIQTFIDSKLKEHS